MRIGINARTFSVAQPGGAVQSAMRLTRELANRGVELVLFGHESIAVDFPNLDVVSRGYIANSQVFGLGWERTVLPRLAAAHDVDVLFCPNGNGPMHRTSVPVVVQIHDVNAIQGYSSRAHQTYRRLTVPRAAAVADAIVTVSEFSKGEVVRHLDVEADEVHVVYNAVDDYFREPGDGEPFDLPDSYVLYVGAMNPRKNVERLVEAFRRIEGAPETPDKLVLIGPERKAIFKALDIEDSPSVVTPGFVTREELKYAYSHAELFAFPSLYEGFGLPPLEAMACGTPVVAGDASALPEVLGDAAEYVDPVSVDDIARGMHRLLSDGEYASNLTKQGFERASKFIWPKAGDDLLDTLENIKLSSTSVV